MRRGLLQDFANTVCDIATGYAIYRDVEALNRIGRGQVTIDLLTGTSSCDSAPLEHLTIAGILRDWLVDRCAGDGVPVDQIVTATLVLDFESRTRADGTFNLSVQARSSIATAESEYEGTAATGW